MSATPAELNEIASIGEFSALRADGRETQPPKGWIAQVYGSAAGGLEMRKVDCARTSMLLG